MTTSQPTAVVVPESALEAPVLSYRTHDCEWELREAYAYTHDGVRLVVPAGFRFDLASVPRLVWWLIAPFELSIIAPLLHDLLYRTGGVPPDCNPPRTYTRAQADALFRDAMRREGVPGWRVASAYAAVRLFGWSAWRTASPPTESRP